MKLQLLQGFGLATAVTTVLVTQPVFAQVVQVTEVQLNSTDEGIEIILETTAGEQLQVLPRTDGNTYIADIPNAQLRLRDGNTFRRDNPTTGISTVTAANQNANSIQVTVTGSEGVPTVELFDSDDGLIFSFTPVASQANQSPQTAATPEAEPDATSAQEDEPIEIVVTGEQETGYSVPNASTATRTDTPLRDIPQSIQVVPEQVLEDQQVVRLQDALQNVSGITKAGNYGGTESGSFILRGFEQEGNFRNGFRDNNFYSFPETANVERIEVLKGPASVLFGQAQPGGIINIITKQPLDEPYYAADFTIGNYDFYRPTFDISGSLNSDATLLYRLNIAYQNSGSFRDFVNTERVFISPVLTWNIGDKTTLTANFEYLYDDPVYDRGILALSNGSIAPIPISRFLGYPQLDTYSTTTYRGGYIFEHSFSEDWQIRNALSITSNKSNGSYSDINGALIDDQFIPRELRDDNSVLENYGSQTEVIGNFATGAIAHQLLVGLELNRRNDFFDVPSAPLPPIDIFNPIYDVSRPTEFTDRFASLTRTDTLGIYLQDQIALLDNLKLLIGGRLDFSEQETTDVVVSTSTNQNNEAFSPRIGIVYQPSEQISLYGSYSRSFLPVIGRSASNSSFIPERGTQYEVGIKGDFLDNRLSATLAAYQITKTNVLTIDEDPNFSVQVGEQRSRGIELDIAGEILPGWNIIASYAYTDAKVTEDNELPVGSRLANVAENTASLWTTYEIQNGNLQGLGFGIGLFYVGERPGFAGFDPPEFKLPSYLRTDAAVSYRRDNWQAQINIRNLFDTEYYETHQGSNIIYPGAPFSVLGNFSVQF